MTKKQNESQGEIEQYLTPSETARELRIAPVTLRKWAQKGMLEAVVTPGGHRRYNYQEIERFAKKHNLPFRENRGREKLHVLIVDDEVQLCRYLMALFSDFEQELVAKCVHDGFEAGYMVHTFRPQVILLDLMMPGIEGYDVCKLIKSDPVSKHIRVIAMTGFPSEENRARILAAGAETCISKPIDKQLLFELMGIEQRARIQDF